MQLTFQLSGYKKYYFAVKEFNLPFLLFHSIYLNMFLYFFLQVLNAEAEHAFSRSCKLVVNVTESANYKCVVYNHNARGITRRTQQARVTLIGELATPYVFTTQKIIRS